MGGYFQFFTKNRPKRHQKRAILHTSQANGGLEPPGPPLATLLSSPVFGRKMLRKSPKCQRPRIRPGNNMVSWRNPLLYHFLTTIHFQLASFYAQNIEKKLAAEILIEQIFEFELKGPEPPRRTCTPVTD